MNRSTLYNTSIGVKENTVVGFVSEKKRWMQVAVFKSLKNLQNKWAMQLIGTLNASAGCLAERVHLFTAWIAYDNSLFFSDKISALYANIERDNSFFIFNGVIYSDRLRNKYLSLAMYSSKLELERK